jgi:hypothetical protein
MGKRWTEEEKATMRKNYANAGSVDDVASMLGRPRCSVIKMALAMGLNRPDPHERAVNRMTSALSDVPTSSLEIAGHAGVSRGTANRVLGLMRDEGLCHIASYRKRPGRGSDIPLWVLGEGDDAQEEADEPVNLTPTSAVAPAAHLEVFRDPFTAMFFGSAA